MLRHRCPATFGLLVLLVLGRGASALAQANADWNVTFQDPTHFDISDAGGVFAKAAVYRDAMEDVLRALMVFPRIATSQPVSSDGATDQIPPGAHRPRAPPVGRGFALV
jgi:hypothetical protein